MWIHFESVWNSSVWSAGQLFMTIIVKNHELKCHDEKRMGIKHFCEPGNPFETIEWRTINLHSSVRIIFYFSIKGIGSVADWLPKNLLSVSINENVDNKYL